MPNNVDGITPNNSESDMGEAMHVASIPDNVLYHA